MATMTVSMVDKFTAPPHGTSWSCPCLCQRAHQALSASIDLLQAVLGTKQLGAEAEAGGAGRQPRRDVGGANAPDRQYAYRWRQHTPECLQMRRAVADRRKQLQFAG